MPVKNKHQTTESAYTCLSRRVRSQASQLGLNSDTVALLFNELAILKRHDMVSAEHCLRVALLAREVAREVGADQQLALAGGLVHDVGKTTMPVRLLRKKRFTKRDFERIQPHAKASYRLLIQGGLPRGIAQVAGLHHRFQARPYGLSRRRKSAKVLHAAEAVGIADAFDAAMTRKNNYAYSQSINDYLRAYADKYFPHRGDDIWHDLTSYQSRLPSRSRQSVSA